MADDSEDDLLFADLYNNDESAPVAAQPPAAPTPAAPEPVQETPVAAETTVEQPNPETAPQTDLLGQGQDRLDMQGQEYNAGGHGDVDMVGHDSAPEPQQIGIKEDGKMFVGGLNWETTDESLKNYFSQFGEVAECTVMRDANTGRSRGFGFLTFKDPKDVNMVMVKEHFLDGKIIDPKRAIPRDEQERTSKIFVGGVSQEATEEDFKNYFSQYGRVIDATLMMDKDTGRPRGFGFVTFDSEAAVDATMNGNLMILGKPIEVKKAQPRGNIKEEDHGGRGGRRGGRHDSTFDGGHMGGAANAQGGGMQTGPNGMQMTPQMMALFWNQMRTMMAMTQGNMMNPMAQMQQMQQMQMMQQRAGQGNSGNMNPQMYQQMMQNMQQQQNGGGQGGQGNSNNGGSQTSTPHAPPGPRADTPGSSQGGYGPGQWDSQSGGGHDSGDGMHQQHGAYGSGTGRGGRYNKNKFDRPPPTGPSNAPANAPTGPKNASMHGGNYRGGRGGRHGSFHPYRR